MGPMSNAYDGLKDASWNEKLAAGLLIAGIVAIGVAPFLISELISPGTDTIMQQLTKAVSLK
jgi:NADH-quinone oxidoreductase subunit M